MGRPSKFTEGRREIILAALRDGQTYQVASAMADVNPATVSMWLGQEDKLWFRDQCKQAEADSEKRLVSVMQSHALGDWRAAKWLLARRFSHWREVPVRDQGVAEELDRLKILKAQVELEYAQARLEMIRNQESEDVSLLAILNEPVAQLTHKGDTDEDGPADEESSYEHAKEAGFNPDGQGNGRLT
jgi:hypothetical protein